MKKQSTSNFKKEDRVQQSTENTPHTYYLTPRQTLLRCVEEETGEGSVQELTADEFIRQNHSSIEQEEEERAFMDLMIHQVY